MAVIKIIPLYLARRRCWQDTAVLLLAHCLLSLFYAFWTRTYSSPSTSRDPPGDRSGFDRSVQTDLQHFYVRRCGPRILWIYVRTSSSEPILSALDLSSYPAAVRRSCSDNGASLWWNRRLQARLTSRRLSEIMLGSSRHRKSIVPLRTVPSRQISFHRTCSPSVRL